MPRADHADLLMSTRRFLAWGKDLPKHGAEEQALLSPLQSHPYGMTRSCTEAGCALPGGSAQRGLRSCAGCMAFIQAGCWLSRGPNKGLINFFFLLTVSTYPCVSFLVHIEKLCFSSWALSIKM